MTWGNHQYLDRTTNAGLEVIKVAWIHGRVGGGKGERCRTV
jgi:hypothetical protein